MGHAVHLTYTFYYISRIYLIINQDYIYVTLNVNVNVFI